MPVQFHVKGLHVDKCATCAVTVRVPGLYWLRTGVHLCEAGSYQESHAAPGLAAISAAWAKATEFTGNVSVTGRSRVAPVNWKETDCPAEMKTGLAVLVVPLRPRSAVVDELMVRASILPLALTAPGGITRVLPARC